MKIPLLSDMKKQIAEDYGVLLKDAGVALRYVCPRVDSDSHKRKFCFGVHFYSKYCWQGSKRNGINRTNGKGGHIVGSECHFHFKRRAEHGPIVPSPKLAIVSVCHVIIMLAMLCSSDCS